MFRTDAPKVDCASDYGWERIFKMMRELQPDAVIFNIIDMREHLPFGQRAKDWAVATWQSDRWREITEGTAIGNRRLIRLPDYETAKIRLRLANAPICPALSEFALYREPDWIRGDNKVLRPRS